MASAPRVEGKIAAPPPDVSAAAAPPSSSAAALSGGGGGGGAGEPLSTLNEPVTATIMRDVRMVGAKLRLVLSPSAPPEAARAALRELDLWGPLVLCLALAALLAASAPGDAAGLVFSSVFVIVWAGAGVVTANASLLGGTTSFFQSVGVLGYCVAPLVLAAAVAVGVRAGVVRAPVVAGAYAWACRASLTFLGDTVPPERRGLAAFPVSLFYAVLAWQIFAS